VVVVLVAVLATVLVLVVASSQKLELPDDTSSRTAPVINSVLYRGDRVTLYTSVLLHQTAAYISTNKTEPTLIEQGLTCHQTHYRSYRDDFYMTKPTD